MTTKRGTTRRPIEITTEGQQLLLQVDAKEADLAAQLGVAVSAAGHWKRGRRLPDQAARHKMELLLGIPRGSWDMAPGSAVVPPLPPLDVPTQPGLGTTLALANERITAVMAALRTEGLSESAKERYESTLAKLLGLRARLERDEELLEDRLVREHPGYQLARAAILRALTPYPEAAAACAKALAETGM